MAALRYAGLEDENAGGHSRVGEQFLGKFDDFAESMMLFDTLGCALFFLQLLVGHDERAHGVCRYAIQHVLDDLYAPVFPFKGGDSSTLW